MLNSENSPRPLSLESSRGFIQSKIYMSKQGERLLQEHPRIIDQIDKAFVAVEQGIAVERETIPVEGGKISYLASGVHSDAYKMELDSDQSFVVRKRKLGDPKRLSGVAYPYSQEMQQIQAISEISNIKALCKANQVQFPEFMFASNEMSCSLFVEGIVPNAVDLEKVLRVVAGLQKHIARHRKELLWKDMYVDVGREKGPYGDMKDVFNSHQNILKQADGSLVWLDPFICDPLRKKDANNAQGPWWKKIFSQSDKKYDYSA